MKVYEALQVGRRGRPHGVTWQVTLLETSDRRARSVLVSAFSPATASRYIRRVPVAVDGRYRCDDLPRGRT